MNRKGLKEYIESGSYFKDSIEWYGDKYLSPVTHKIWAAYILMLLAVMLAALLSNIDRLLPMIQSVRYALFIQNTYGPDKNIRILTMQADDVTTPAKFIAGTLLKSYIINRESYDYDKLNTQFQRVANSSTRLIFKRFDSAMKIDNPDSPIIKYQKYAKRSVTITHIKFISDTEAIIEFNSLARDDSSNILENMKWQVDVAFEMGDVRVKRPNGSRFDFTVTDYKLKFVGDNNGNNTKS
jgi:type IV secretion system protein VirB8